MPIYVHKGHLKKNSISCHPIQIFVTTVFMYIVLSQRKSLSSVKLGMGYRNYRNIYWTWVAMNTNADRLQYLKKENVPLQATEALRS